MIRTLALSILLLTVVPVSARAAPPTVIVVVDAGHGGTAQGAVGVTGALEKRITLRAAKALEQALRKQVGLKVVMTRTTDTYLTLSERVRRANRSGGHLFVSLHCNASADHKQQGFEAFVLSPAGLEQQARPLATGPLTVEAALQTQQPRRLALSATLADLGRRGLRRRSVAFGRRLVTQLSRSLGATRSRGLQQARFDVLRGLGMPGVLVEMGFLDHPVEGKQVVTRRYLLRVVHAVTQAVLGHGRRFGLLPGREAAKAGGTPGAAPTNPRQHRRRDRRRPAPTRDQQLFLKPEVAVRNHSA